MSRLHWAAGATLIALLAAGMAPARSVVAAQDPTGALNTTPPADPIGDVLKARQQAPAPQEEAPPPPGEVPSIVPPAPRELTQDGAEPDEEEIEEAETTASAEQAETTPAEPMRRPRYRTAVLQALDKITAETIRFEAPVGRPIRWKGLVFTVRACETTAPDEPMRDTIAYLEVRSQPRVEDRRTTSRQVFQGWMFASSPGLNALEHPVYDAWVIACQAAEPDVS